MTTRFSIATLAATMLAAVSLINCRASTPQEPAFELSGLFNNGMVLQRDMPIPVWGWAPSGQKVTARLNGRSASAVSANGKWILRLPAMKAGGPFTLSITGPVRVDLRDVWIGDVWLCTGQSNMEFGVGNLADAKQVIADANHPGIHLFMVPHSIPMQPQAQVHGEWQACSPESIASGGWSGFSAVGYFFGRFLREHLHVPIGLIETSWGGTIAESWTSAEGLQLLPDFQGRLEKRQQMIAAGQNTHGDPNFVTVLYNGMIAPLIPYGIKGAIWYQGESNTDRAYQYRKLLPALIADWRHRWGEGDFPFLIVQLAAFMHSHPQPSEDDWAELREAQLMTAASVPNCGLAVTSDIGNADDIHPKDKLDVGRRLGLAALAVAYHRKLYYSGPIYRSMTVKGSSIRLQFNHVDGGLVAQGGEPLTGFAIAGADRKFVWANAKIVGSTIIVSAAAVPDPVAVRYAWDANPVANLYNKAGLPASAFRTDDWPGHTFNRK
ncbi:MAG TPA: sialate O-acetylesterase [Chthonomonadales bacterium]|nr:sialate O-acetylesterase [Chthonomonadales bacterium]